VDFGRRPTIYKVLSECKEKCYHTVSRDLSCRPHEILKLRLKDIHFKNSGNHQYAEVLLNRKTGNRNIPLINSIPYLKDWIDQHPQAGNPNSPLICGFGKKLFQKKFFQ
jgi:integrase